MSKTYKRYDDEDDALELVDQQTMRVPLMMMDADAMQVRDHLQRDVARHLADSRRHVAGAGHRPGFRAFSDTVTNDATRDAYEDALYEQLHAWRRGPVHDADAPEGPEGAACVVKNSAYPDDFGSPGTIIDGECVPDRVSRPTDRMTTAAVYAERDAWQQVQWKTGGPQAARNPSSRRTDTKSLADAHRDREAAYSEHLDYLRDAWKRQ